jgi:hypothetical protein
LLPNLSSILRNKIVLICIKTFSKWLIFQSLFSRYLFFFQLLFFKVQYVQTTNVSEDLTEAQAKLDWEVRVLKISLTLPPQLQSQRFIKIKRFSSFCFSQIVSFCSDFVSQIGYACCWKGGGGRRGILDT